MLERTIANVFQEPKNVLEQSLQKDIVYKTSFPGFLFYAPAPRLKETLVSAGHMTLQISEDLLICYRGGDAKYVFVTKYQFGRMTNNSKGNLVLKLQVNLHENYE